MKTNDATSNSPNLGLNKACAADELTSAARVLHRLVLETFTETGRAPARSDLERMAHGRGIDPSTSLYELATRDVVALDEQGEIRAAYPFSPVPTRHRVTWQGGSGAYAMCAIDALGMSAMLGVRVTIFSSEPGTERAVTVEVDHEIARWQPDSAVVFAGKTGDGCCPSVDRTCDHINFFASSDAARAHWPSAAALAGLLALALSGRLALAETATAAGALLILGERILTTVNNIGDLYQAGLFVEDYTTFLATAPHQHGHTGTWPAPAKFDRITVENASFTYPAASGPALPEVSLEIQAGRVIALVGENGSGKTTLAKLLSRLYLPATGTIRWDGTDTAVLDPDELHRRIAVIFQDFARYDLTARENIGFGAVEHIDDLADVEAAARHAGSDSYLSELPKGYETILSPEYDGGRDLSVGQWQRVALARAFIRDAPLIILDEPTASLDPRAEHDLFRRIRSLYKGRTVLLISHQYNTVRDADHIYVLDEGRSRAHIRKRHCTGRPAVTTSRRSTRCWTPEPTSTPMVPSSQVAPRRPTHGHSRNGAPPIGSSSAVSRPPSPTPRHSASSTA